MKKLHNRVLNLHIFYQNSMHFGYCIYNERLVSFKYGESYATYLYVCLYNTIAFRVH